MKANRYQSAMVFLFLGLMLLLWALELGGVRPRSEKERRADRILPDLIDVPEVDVRRVAIDRAKEHLVFERRGKGPGKWQMVEPKDVAAEPVRLDALVRNLKELRKDPDAGTVQGDPKQQGLDPPAATVRLYTGPSGSASSEAPIAAIELGKAVDLGASGRRLCYVRPVGGAGADVIDGRLIAAVEQPIVDWRQPNILSVPTFQVKEVRIVRRDQPGGKSRVIRAERSPSGQWSVEVPTETAADAPRRDPLRVPANGPKVESLLAALASLRVAEPPRGYVADGVKDLAAYGLGTDRAEISVEVRTDKGDPIQIEIGKAVPDESERVYLRQGGQDDVVMVEARAMTDIPPDVTALRSQQIAEIIPRDVVSFEIDTQKDTFRIERAGRSWNMTSPRKEPADGQSVGDFLTHMQELQTSEFLDPSKVPDPMLDPPVMRIKVRQGTGGPGAEPRLTLDLRTGRHDVARKTVYARLEGDTVILALPDKVIEVLPKNPLAFRDRGIVKDDPARITRLLIRRGNRVDELVQDRKGVPNAWKMLRPVEARGDVPTITQTLAMLSSLRAREFSGASIAEAPYAGLNRPLMEIEWESDAPHRLKIGAMVPRSSSFFAASDAEPMVFTLPAETVRALDSEYHDHRVEVFPEARAHRVVLHFYGRTLALKHRPPQKPGQVEWVPETGSDAAGLDLSRIGSLVHTMANLQTRRFIQYDGELPIDTGLSRPRLTVEVSTEPKDPVRVLRIGTEAGDGTVCAATGTGPTGPAFLLPGASWNELIRSGERPPTLPEDVFAR